ncbi:glycosyltransferase family 4 protein [Bifidobacterium cuniculi]|nr:glycosyltransferase family 4 protein [Bifidobacterium cuniculi]
MSYRIGFVFDDTLDVLDGVQQHVVTLGRELARRGHQVSYLVGETHHSPVPHTVSLARNVMVRFNGNRMRIPLPAPLTPIRQALTEGDFDILHVQAPYSPLLAGRILDHADERTGVVATYHIAASGPASRVGGRLLGALNAHSHRRVDEVIAVSQVAAAYAQGTAHVRGTVVPNPVDPSVFRAAQPDVPTDNHVVFLGRFVPRKGARTLLEALAYGERHGLLPEGLHATFIGDGPLLDECRRFASGLATPVEFTGAIYDAPRKAALLADADVAVFPATDGETFGIVLLEAIASGAGVTLAGDNPGYRWTMRGDADALFPVDGDGVDRILAERIVRALTDRPWAQELHDRESRLLERYDVATVANQVEAVYARAIADRRR